MYAPRINPIVTNIKLHDTGKRHMMPAVFDYKREVKEITDAQFNQAIRYRASVVFGLEAVAHDKSELAFIRTRATQQFLHAIYGPFIPMLLEIERALYENDIVAARQLLAKMHNEMMLP